MKEINFQVISGTNLVTRHADFPLEIRPPWKSAPLEIRVAPG